MSHQRLSPTWAEQNIAGLRARPIGQILMDQGSLDAGSALLALGEHGLSRAPVSHVCFAEGLVDEKDLLKAQCLHYGASELDPDISPPDAELADLLPTKFCLKHAILPWVRVGETLVLACALPENFDAIQSKLPDDIGPVMMGIASESALHKIIAQRHGQELAKDAENWVLAQESCRDLNQLTPMRALFFGLVAIVALGVLAIAPSLFFGVLLGWAIVSLLGSAVLKLAAFAAQFRRKHIPRATIAQSDDPYPYVSILVPLFKEDNIATHIVKRLSRLSYPKAKLDVVLVLEQQDQKTRLALNQTTLPAWMRVIEVPEGAVTTKPRALNYALKFCRGSIVGIFDAEDAPAPDQIDRVVQAFADAPSDVACLQGILDFYNPHANWLSRCFTVEYATWFRVILPGLSKLGFAIPLGGTTVFFRRDALERLRGWDAHNVTEDADLGIRLARYGYRTELFDSVTREEANNRFWPWIKQRSRWLKGYMVTYLVHMRRPRQLLRDLGAWQFTGFQLFFLTSISQFLFAPILWSFWVIPFGLWHPALTLFDKGTLMTVAYAFLSTEALALCVGMYAVAKTRHHGLWAWVPTLHLYFPLGTIAAYKAVYELMLKPFYWDKTSHGHSAPQGDNPEPSR